MADNFVQVPADDVGKNIETHEVTDGNGDTVQRQVISVGDMPNVDVATLPAITGTVVANTGLAQPLTDAQLRASDVGTEIHDMTVALYNLLEFLARPIYISGSTGRMNATVDTVTTVSTVSALTSIGGYDTYAMYFSQYRERFNSGIGSRIA